MQRCQPESVYSKGRLRHFRRMKELIRTNDPVVISFVESLMRDAGIAFFVADGNMSILEGSLGVLPRRVLVEDDRFDAARRILVDAGIGAEAREG